MQPLPRAIFLRLIFISSLGRSLLLWPRSLSMAFLLVCTHRCPSHAALIFSVTRVFLVSCFSVSLSLEDTCLAKSGMFSTTAFHAVVSAIKCFQRTPELQPLFANSLVLRGYALSSVLLLLCAYMFLTFSDVWFHSDPLREYLWSKYMSIQASQLGKPFETSS